MTEPKLLKNGKRFHLDVQRDWKHTAKDGRILLEEVIKLFSLSHGTSRIRKGRLDILVDEVETEDGPMVSIVEIKNTDWDRIKAKNITKNLGSHRRQIWNYIDEFLENAEVDVCPGIIYPSSPKAPGLRDRIENYLNDYGIQVVWYRE